MTTFRSRARRAACDREFRLTRAHHQNSTTSEDANILASELDGHCQDGLGYSQGLRTLRSDVLERPRRRRRQAPSRPVQPTGALAQDQEPGLFAGGRSGRSVQPTTAVGTMKYTGPAGHPRQLSRSAGAAACLVPGLPASGRARPGRAGCSLWRRSAGARLGREAGLLAMRQPEHRFRAHRCALRSIRGGIHEAK